MIVCFPCYPLLRLIACEGCCSIQDTKTNFKRRKILPQMKNLVTAIMATAMTIAFLNTYAQIAQNAIAKLEPRNITRLGADNEAANNINTAYKSTSTLSKASARAMKDFTKSFNSPANATWYDDGNSGFIAYFQDSTTSTHVDYDKKGNWVYTMSIYSENELPNNVKYNVKSAYPMFTINGVQEIHFNNLTAYIIHAEDKNSYKTFRYTDEGGVEEIEVLQKTPPYQAKK